jgi:NAD(P)-dependent dehydrogenase (short-subunit alcohol dehydrogenase family)
MGLASPGHLMNHTECSFLRTQKYCAWTVANRRMEAMSELNGQVIVITGGETGIGRATVLQMAAEGAHVLIGGVLADEAEVTLRAAEGCAGSVAFQKTDVRVVAEVDALIDTAVEKHGRIDGLVCNAGVFDGFASGIDTSDRLWDHIMDVNARGTFFACRAALRHMVPAAGGKIVNVASIGGLVGMADGASYTASKHAVIGLTKHLGCYYAKDGIAVNAVCPGAIETPLRNNSIRLLGEDAPPMGGVGADPEWLKRTVPQQRKGSPDEIAHMIIFLLSEKATYMAGQSFVVDGGWTAK